MDMIVLNQNFEKIAVIDAYESLLWTDRYNKPGEFEIYTPVAEFALKYPVANNYLQIRESEHTMIIEDTTIESNVENGNHIKIVGRSLESILDRRAIIAETTITGSLQNGVKKLITENIIIPTDSDRAISNFIFEDSTDTKILEMTLDVQYKEGENLLEAIEDICEEKEIGFKVVLDDEDRFVFSLYNGTDRSYRQETNPFVVFKPSFENIINSNYAELNSEAKTFCYVHASYSNSGSSGSTEVTRTVGSGTGLLRKEVYKSASISMEDGMSLAQFYALMDEEATKELKEKKVKKTFDGECETTRMFVYKRDFYMGDVVQVANEYGMEAPSRVTEYIWSSSESGLSNYPTFTALDDEVTTEQTNS